MVLILPFTPTQGAQIYLSLLTVNVLLNRVLCSNDGFLEDISRKNDRSVQRTANPGIIDTPNRVRPNLTPRRRVV